VLSHLLREGATPQTLVFTRTKHGANRLAEQLEKDASRSPPSTGNKSQNARTKALRGFQGLQGAGTRRHRHRGTRPRHSELPQGGELTTAPRARGLRAPHRPTGARVRPGRRCRWCRATRRTAARHRACSATRSTCCRSTAADPRPGGAGAQPRQRARAGLRTGPCGQSPASGNGGSRGTTGPGGTAAAMAAAAGAEPGRVRASARIVEVLAVASSAPCTSAAPSCRLFVGSLPRIRLTPCSRSEPRGAGCVGSRRQLAVRDDGFDLRLDAAGERVVLRVRLRPSLYRGCRRRTPLRSRPSRAPGRIGRPLALAVELQLRDAAAPVACAWPCS